MEKLSEIIRKVLTVGLMVFAMGTTVFAAEGKYYKEYSGSFGAIEISYDNYIGRFELAMPNANRPGKVDMREINVVRDADKIMTYKYGPNVKNPMDEVGEELVPYYYVWDDADNAFRIEQGGYKVEKGNELKEFYSDGEKLLKCSVNVIDQNGYGYALGRNILVLSEEDEKYFLENGTIPGYGNFEWTGLKEFLLNQPKIVENARFEKFSVYVNSSEVELEAYTIREKGATNIHQEDSEDMFGKHYVKIRDVAAIANGTENQFNIVWNQEKNAIEFQTKTPYKEIGTELHIKDQTNKWASRVYTPTYIDGISEFMGYSSEIYGNYIAIYNINGENYMTIDEIKSKFGIELIYDKSLGTVYIDSIEQASSSDQINNKEKDIDIDYNTTKVVTKNKEALKLSSWREYNDKEQFKGFVENKGMNFFIAALSNVNQAEKGWILLQLRKEDGTILDTVRVEFPEFLRKRDNGAHISFNCGEYRFGDKFVLAMLDSSDSINCFYGNDECFKKGEGMLFTIGGSGGEVYNLEGGKVKYIRKDGREVTSVAPVNIRINEKVLKFQH